MFQLVQAFEEVNNVKIPYEIVDRRPGDLATVLRMLGELSRSWVGKLG